MKASGTLTAIDTAMAPDPVPTSATVPAGRRCLQPGNGFFDQQFRLRPGNQDIGRNVKIHPEKFPVTEDVWKWFPLFEAMRASVNSFAALRSEQVPDGPVPRCAVSRKYAPTKRMHPGMVCRLPRRAGQRCPKEAKPSYQLLIARSDKYSNTIFDARMAVISPWSKGGETSTRSKPMRSSPCRPRTSWSS